MFEGLRAGLYRAAMMALATACAAAMTDTTETPPEGASGVAKTAPSSEENALVARGRYMTAAADCAPCHQDPRTGAEFAGGRALPTPFGTLLSANITPDDQTGIGQWTDTQFEAAVREGRLPDGARLYPAMPYVYYRKLSHEDLLAIRAYLRTVAPVRHAVTTNQLPFPFNIRAGMHLWDALYFKDEPFSPDPSESPAWNRGAYLVQGPGHCAACHTSKNFLGADRADRNLQGYSLQGWFAPNITGDEKRGLGGWSVPQIVALLKNGHSAMASVSGPMGEVVIHSTTRMSDEDLDAIAVYLKGQRSQPMARTPVAASDPQMKAGAAIYHDVCSACHQHDGQGVPYMVPNLSKDPAVASGDASSIVQVLLHGDEGLATPGEPTGASMPSFGWKLSDEQLAAVATYIRNSWGNAAPATPEKEFRKARAATQGPKGAAQ